MPRVSVIIPNYNHAQFLEQRIESVLAQTYRDFDLLLLDDASTDDSLAILQRYADRPHVRLMVNQQNTGNPFVQWNHGVEQSTGELVWIAESDDLANPNLLERLVACFDGDTDVSLAYCASSPIDEQGRVLGRIGEDLLALDSERWFSDFVNDGQHEVLGYLSHINTIPNASAVVFKRSAFEDCGGAQTGCRLMGDWITWIGLVSQGKIAYVAEPMNQHRWHGGTVRSRVSTSALRMWEMYQIIRTLDERVTLPSGQRREMCYAVTRNWMRLVLRRTGDPWSLHRRIFQEGKSLDPRFFINFPKALVSALSDRLGVLGAIRWMLGRSYG